MGGEVSGSDEVIGAVAERLERGVDVIKVMASGGANTPGTDVMLCRRLKVGSDRFICIAGRRPLFVCRAARIGGSSRARDFLGLITLREMALTRRF